VADDDQHAPASADTDATQTLLAPTPRTVRSLFPILDWLVDPATRRALPRDLVAGLALAALLIPESMGYASVAGVPPEVGLYAALAAVIGYALTGGTSILVVGPAAAVSALTASLIAGIGGDDPVTTAVALALFSGLVALAAGALRLGWIVNFISRPVLEAFVAGLAISIIIGQLDGLFGIGVDGESPLGELVDLLGKLDEAHSMTVIIGVGAVVALLLLERFAEKIPAAIVVVVVGIVAAVVFDLADEGVALVGEIPQGLPSVGIPDLGGLPWLELLAGGFALLLVGFSEGYAAAATIAEHTREHIDPDQELIGAGTASIASSFAGGLAVSGSLSKSAASEAAGARTQVTNLVAGAVVIATLLFLAPVFENLPEPVLASVVIVAVLRSANPMRVTEVWSINRLDFAAAMTTFVLVLVWETLPAMIVGVVLSLAFVVHRASFPDVVALRRRGDEFMRPDAEGVDGAELDDVAGVAVMRFEAPLVYANGDRLLRAARRLVGARDDLHRFVLDAEMIADIDATGAARLVALDDWLRERHIELHLARVHTRARHQIARSRLRDRFAGRTHPTVHDAVGVPAGPGAQDTG
jgi:high affinity sulfate transporter 1